MKNHAVILPIILIFTIPVLKAQRIEYKLSPSKTYQIPNYYKYCGFNSNLLLSQFVPYSYKKIVALNASILYRTYNERNRGYRFGFGLNTGNYGFSNIHLLTFSFESDKRRKLGDRWYIFNGFGAHNGYAGPTFNRNRQTAKDNEIFLATSFHLGAEFIVNDILSLSTEFKLWTGVIFGSGNDISKFDAPINLMAHFNLSSQN